jgi:hypothetical protein
MGLGCRECDGGAAYYIIYGAKMDWTNLPSKSERRALFDDVGGTEHFPPSVGVDRHS